MSPLSLFPTTAPHPANLNIPTRDKYRGVVVIDEYRWLEDGDDPAVRTWTDAERPGTEKTVLDPNELEPKGQRQSMIITSGIRGMRTSRLAGPGRNTARTSTKDLPAPVRVLLNSLRIGSFLRKNP
jgi:hypothetical protein